jgi:hypothetical protein
MFSFSFLSILLEAHFSIKCIVNWILRLLARVGTKEDNERHKEDDERSNRITIIIIFFRI